MLDALKSKMNLRDSAAFENLKTLGNTVSCTIPIAIAEFREQGGGPQNVALVGFE